MSAEENLRKLRGKRTLEIQVNSRSGKFSSEFCGKWGIRVECTLLRHYMYHCSIIIFILLLYFDNKDPLCDVAFLLWQIPFRSMKNHK